MGFSLAIRAAILDEASQPGVAYKAAALFGDLLLDHGDYCSWSPIQFAP